MHTLLPLSFTGEGPQCACWRSSACVWPQGGDTPSACPSEVCLWAALTQNMMEQTGEPPHSNNNPAGNEPPPACGLHSKRLKELENAALQTTLISRMETESGADAGSWTEQQPGEDEQSNGLSLNHRPAPPQLSADAEEEEAESGGNVAKERVEEERTLTDHLNKRLLSSFLEKLNERDLALPGVQRLDCAVADEDSNRAADEWWGTGLRRSSSSSNMEVAEGFRTNVHRSTIPQL